MAAIRPPGNESGSRHIGAAPPDRARGRGRPARTSIAELVEAAVALGLDRFTLAAVAERVGIGESTVYNYVPSRDALFVKAAATVFAALDVEVDATGWTDYVGTVADRAVQLARRHPGLREYVFAGPFDASTISLFETLIERVRQLASPVSEEVAFVLVSRPLILSLGYIGDPVLEPSMPWLRRALINGMDALLQAGIEPPPPQRSWRTKLHSQP